MTSLVSQNIDVQLFDKKNKPKEEIIISKDKQWILAEPEDINDLSDIIKNKITYDINTYNDIFGFIINIKNEYMTFKTKEITTSKDKGARCLQAGKQKIIRLLNKIVGEEKYIDSNTKKLTTVYLCVLQEFILRLYNYENKNDKIWFLNPVDSIINNVESIKK